MRTPSGLKFTFSLMTLLILLSSILVVSEVFSQGRSTRSRRPSAQNELTPEQADRLGGLAEMGGEGNPKTDVPLKGISGFHGTIRNPRQIVVDENVIKNAKLNILKGKHLTLVTDLPLDEDLQKWPGYFDQQLEQLDKYFEVDPAKTAEWHLTAFLMKNNVPFIMADLLPDFLPQFDHGFSFDNFVWLFAQESKDYQRHLFIHECTHSYMNMILGGCGAIWYGEGLAEFFGTHRIDDKGKLQLGIMPVSRNEFPHWGRIRFILDDLREGKFVPLYGFMTTDLEKNNPGELRSQDARSYSWFWALVWMLNSKPEYKQVLVDISKDLGKAATYKSRAEQVNQQFRQHFDIDQWHTLCNQWSAFISDLDYGCDGAAAGIIDSSVIPLFRTAYKEVKTNVSWQNSGISLEAGKTYQVLAEGKYIVHKPDTKLEDEALGTKAWPCTPDGITIQYIKERPLGCLMASVIIPDEGFDAKLSGFNKPMAVGTKLVFKPEQSGSLWFKINEPIGNLSDNEGVLKIEITEIQPPAPAAEAPTTEDSTDSADK